MQKKNIPEEYVDYLLMDHFRCLPSELDEEDHVRLIEFLSIKGLVNESIEKDQKNKSRMKYGKS